MLFPRTFKLQLGTTKINEFVDIAQFYTNYILPELQSPDVNALPVLKADAIKYILTFRNQVCASLFQGFAIVC